MSMLKERRRKKKEQSKIAGVEVATKRSPVSVTHEAPKVFGFMLNVTDHYCISPATSKGGFPVTRVICHESVIYVTGHVSHRSEAQGLLPRITRQCRNINLLIGFTIVL